MKRLLVALAAIAAVALPPAAHAGGPSAHHGECSFHPVLLETATGAHAGTVSAAVVLYSTDPGGNPVSATVRCEVRVNGSTQAWAAAHGTGVVTVLDSVAFSATYDDALALCTVVDYDDATPTSDACATHQPTQLPPQVVWDTLDGVLTRVDPVACELLRLLPDLPGVVDVDEEGDVYVYGEPFWDCPPYDIWPPA